MDMRMNQYFRKMRLAILGFVLMIFSVDFTLANWEVWWTYEGISGPAYWGLINPSWTMCNKVELE